MSDDEWHDIRRYNLIMPQKSVMRLYNIKSVSDHYNTYSPDYYPTKLSKNFSMCMVNILKTTLTSIIIIIIIIITIYVIEDLCNSLQCICNS